jgi:hypothetical protein
MSWAKIVLDTFGWMIGIVLAIAAVVGTIIGTVYAALACIHALQDQQWWLAARWGFVEFVVFGVLIGTGRWAWSLD